MLQKRAEAGISGASTISDIQVFEPARIENGILKFPNKANIYLFGLLLGIIIPLLIILLKNVLNDKVISRRDIERITAIPFFGFIAKNHSGIDLIVNHSPKSSIAETFRVIRSNLNFINSEKSTKMIVVTSSTSGEGKTFCAKNLAALYASTGKKTILIGADLRKPKLYLDFDKFNQLGLSTFLIGANTLDQVIKTSSINNLDVITSGPIPPNPSELLTKKK